MDALKGAASTRTQVRTDFLSSGIVLMTAWSRLVENAMITVAFLVALGGLVWGGHATAQVSVQQQQQQFQAEQNRLGYEQQRQTQQYQAPAQQSYGHFA